MISEIRFPGGVAITATSADNRAHVARLAEDAAARGGRINVFRGTPGLRRLVFSLVPRGAEFYVARPYLAPETKRTARDAVASGLKGFDVAPD